MFTLLYSVQAPLPVPKGKPFETHHTAIPLRFILNLLFNLRYGVLTGTKKPPIIGRYLTVNLFMRTNIKTGIIWLSQLI